MIARVTGWKALGIGLDQRLHRRIALGDPRTVVEHAGDLGEGLEVELDDAGAERLSEPNVLREGGRGVLVVEELKLIRARNAEPNPARERRKSGLAERAAVGVLFVERDRLAKRHEGVGDIAGEDRDGVERAAGGDDAGGGESPERRLQSDNAVERRRHATRSRRVGAKRERNEARADRGRRAGARSAGNEIRAQRIARNAVGRAYAHKPGRELIEVGLADDDCAGALEPLDDER